MRAVVAAASGYVRPDATDIFWERYGSGDPPILFFSGDTIVDSRMWKGQIGWFARRHTVVTFDPPGNGRSARTLDADAYSDAALLADAWAVLDAAGVDAAVFVGVCSGAGLSLLAAAERAERVLGVVAINPGVMLTPRHPHRRPGDFDVVRGDDTGWNKENRHYWLRDWRGYADFFFGEMLPEPHSTKQHDDCVAWASATSAEIMLADADVVPVTPRADPEAAAEMCRSVRCPVLVINGDADMCQPPERSRRVADLTGAELVVMEGSGHLPHARDPVKVNLEIARFVRRLPV